MDFPLDCRRVNRFPPRCVLFSAVGAPQLNGDQSTAATAAQKAHDGVLHTLGHLDHKAFPGHFGRPSVCLEELNAFRTCAEVRLKMGTLGGRQHAFEVVEGVVDHLPALRI